MLSLIFLDFALDISFLFEFRIDCELVLKYWANCFKTEFLLSIFKLDNKKIAQIRNSIEEIIKFKDPIG